MYKKIHTTSTKCQYNIPASYPKWWCCVKWYLIKRRRPTDKNIVPIITCSPWNPVPKKKQVPNAPSLIVNEDTLYSITCSKVKTTAKIIVNIVPYNPPDLFLLIKEWWPYVIVAPLDNNITVFNNGNSKGLMRT